MSYKNLTMAAEEVLMELSLFINKNGSNPQLDSIRNQMLFIKKHSEKNINPVKMLDLDREFTYGIISSREFSSGEEMRIKEKLNDVSDQLRTVWEEG